ncbi:hypothetical protein RQP54_05815 [Curvibacter sp. APW13]|uniref:hypothetical protein n=1 Tax=Curvibacter sp. APW13 TaxID=3077236 RepID=UPI0028DFED95|nr:hypothetical protein [Curvibacter sp. APW13]MDT8990378.1 hypothetical protein [Curvibacter sp. APW13]
MQLSVLRALTGGALPHASRRTVLRAVLCAPAFGQGASAWAQARVIRLSMMEGVPTITAKPLATLQRAYRNLGFELEVETMPFARSLLAADRGEVDGEVARLPHIEESARNLRRVPIVINQTEYVPYVLQGTRTDMNSWDRINASGLRVGARRGARLTEDSVREDRLTLVNTYESLLGMLLLGRIDVAIAPKGQLEEVIPSLDGRARAELPRLQPLGVFATVPVYHYLHQRNESLIPQLTKEIVRIQSQAPVPTGR